MSEENHAPPVFVQDLFSWYSITLLALGLRTGLLEALVVGPGTAEEIAARAGVDRRNAYEWLRGLSAGGHATHESGTFTLTPETEMVLGPAFPVDARAILRFTLAVPDVMDDLVQAMRSGKGLSPATFGALSEAAGGVNTPTYAAALVPEWIASVPGLADRLAAGGTVADLAAGSGAAAALVGKAFPASRVVGYDVVPSNRDDLPANVEMRVADARELPDDGPFDLVYCLDSFHHLGDPVPVLSQIRRVLADDGVVMLIEADLSGDLDADVADPFAVVVYAAGLLYCLQESLAAGGDGHSNGDGPQWILDALEKAGFRDATVTPSPTGFAVIAAVAGPGG